MNNNLYHIYFYYINDYNDLQKILKINKTIYNFIKTNIVINKLYLFYKPEELFLDNVIKYTIEKMCLVTGKKIIKMLSEIKFDKKILKDGFYLYFNGYFPANNIYAIYYENKFRILGKFYMEIITKIPLNFLKKYPENILKEMIFIIDLYKTKIIEDKISFLILEYLNQKIKIMWNFNNLYSRTPVEIYKDCGQNTIKYCINYTGFKIKNMTENMIEIETI